MVKTGFVKFLSGGNAGSGAALESGRPLSKQVDKKTYISSLADAGSEGGRGVWSQGSIALRILGACWVLHCPVGGFGAAGVADPQETVRVQADFGRWIDDPLVKTKFGVYNSGYVPGYVEAYRRDFHLFEEVRPDSLRFDGGLGSPRGILFSDPQMISGTPRSIEYDFRQVDRWLELLREAGVTPYWCYSYVPGNLVGPGESFRHPPSDIQTWAEVIGSVAAHFREKGYTIGYHEIYNEPDNRDFFRGTMDDYFAMYASAVRAIREVDPDARVGGPALAFSDSWVEPFLDLVVREDLPLDFFSFHYYPGSPYRAGDIRGVVEMVRRELDRRQELATTEMHLNEYNSLPINYPLGGPQQKHSLAAALLDDFSYFLSEPHLTKVHWAQFMDTGGGNWSGMISVEGRRKAVFNAYKIYSMMPVDRRHVSVTGPAGVGAMASSDEHTAGLVMWNRTEANHPVSVNLSRIPFERGGMRIYRIDADHASWGDDPENEELVPVDVRTDVPAGESEWNGELPAGGVVYIEANDGTGESELAEWNGAKALRVLHYYPDRRKSAYAHFDPNTWIARLGMGGEESADARVGVVVEEMPATMRISTEMDGTPARLDEKSLVGVRIDFHTDGEYANPVLFSGPYRGGPDLFGAGESLESPWGAGSATEAIVRVDDLSEFAIDVTRYAPSGWDGRALITFIVRNAGPGVRAKMIVR